MLTYRRTVERVKRVALEAAEGKFVNPAEKDRTIKLGTVLALLGASALAADANSPWRDDLASVGRSVYNVLVNQGVNHRCLADMGRSLYGGNACPKCGFLLKNEECEVCGGLTEGLPSEDEIDRAIAFIEKFIPQA